MVSRHLPDLTKSFPTSALVSTFVEPDCTIARLVKAQHEMVEI